MARLPGLTVEEKLRLNVVQTGDGCWRWTGAHTPAGYGQLYADGKRRAVHRLTYEIWVGPIPTDLEIDHTCRTRDCINPAHLEPVTHQENLRRMQAARTHCNHGHEFTPDNIRWHRGRGGSRIRNCRRCRNIARRKPRPDAPIVAVYVTEEPS